MRRTDRPFVTDHVGEKIFRLSESILRTQASLPVNLHFASLIEGLGEIYRKNIGSGECSTRFATGGGINGFLCGLVGLGATPPGILVAATGTATVVTDLPGYCPACMIAGREISKK